MEKEKKRKERQKRGKKRKGVRDGGARESDVFECTEGRFILINVKNYWGTI